MKKSHGIVSLIVILLIIAVVIGMIHKKAIAPVVEKDGMKTYTENDFGFKITFPSDWLFEDRLTGQSCCLFIAHWTTSTSTVPNASGTPVETITQKELIKIQVGVYDKRTQDLFTSAVHPVTLNGKTFYTAYTETGEYFLFPRDQNTGLGIAEFRYKETPQSDIDAVHKIVGSITYTDATPATIVVPKQSATTTTATSTRK